MNTRNENAAAPINGTQVTASQQSDVNTATQASADTTSPLANVRQRKLDAMRQADANGPKVDPAVVAAKHARPAPDNSTFTSYLADAGYEIRTFKNHPQLLKVEKKITSDGKQTIKVFLRNGRVIDLPGERIDPLSTVPAAAILGAAGIQTPPGQTRSSQTSGSKKPGM